MKKHFELRLDKWTDLLVALDEKKSLSEISYALQMTYSHAHTLLTEFEQRKWIKTQKIGRRRNINILAKGNKVFNTVKELQILLEED